jgi:hypothetical protein
MGSKKVAKKVTGKAAKRAKPFKLEVGKEYVMRNGEKAKVEKREGQRGSISEFQGRMGWGRGSWRRDGRVWSIGESDYDLVREVPAAKPSTPSPKSPAKGRKGASNG